MPAGWRPGGRRRSLPGVYGLGRLQEHDPRSLRFAVEVPDRDPTNKTWRCGVVLNQGHTSACTGFSRVADLLAAPRMVKVDDPQDMAQRTYKLAQTLDEWPGEDYEGSSVLGALKAVQGLGFIGEYRWAFDFGDWLRSLSYVGPSVVGIKRRARPSSPFFARPRFVRSRLWLDPVNFYER